MQQRWLITGASGQLGSHIVRQLARDADRPQLLALVGRYETGTPDVTTHDVNLADVDEMRECVATFAPTHIIHAAALTAVNDCHRNPETAKRINVSATRLLADLAEECGARFVFTSTDMVFDGDDAPYSEDDEPQPMSRYGQSKHAAEQALTGRPYAVTARIPLLYGYPCAPRDTTFTRQMAALNASESLRLFTDEFRTPVWLADAARALIGLARSEYHGVIHVSGPERLSRFELVERCATLLGVPAKLLVPCSRLDIDSPEPRPADLSLTGDRFSESFPELTPGPLTAAALEPCLVH